MIRILAPHFVAGAKLGTPAGFVLWPIAPIIKYMLAWPLSRVEEYCAKKGWTLEIYPPEKTP